MLRLPFEGPPENSETPDDETLTNQSAKPVDLSQSDAGMETNQSQTTAQISSAKQKEIPSVMVSSGNRPALFVFHSAVSCLRVFVAEAHVL